MNEQQPNLARRRLIQSTGASAVAVTALAAAGVAAVSSPAEAQGVNDAAILNFALNLEYLEAEFYAKAYYGVGLVALGVIPASVGAQVTYPVTNRVTFKNPLIADYAAEITNDEIAHVKFLRSALGSAAVAEPAIDLQNSFNGLAKAVGLGSTFDPYASETNFLLGAFVFEDVGVTAYHGAAPLISNKDYIPPAAGILSVEAYHASLVRTTLYNLNYNDPSATLAKAVNLISQLRDSLDGPADLDQGITNPDGSANIVPTDSNGIVFARTTRQVLNIVYAAPGASKGGFFPAGANGTIK